MTNEEKKAVKSFKQENENDLSRFEDFNDYTQTLIKRNNTISNLIKKQQVEIEKYKYLYQKALDNTIKSDRENIRKDKIIDEMAGYLASIDFDEHCVEVPGICIGCPKEDDLDGYMQCIKQYFEKKVVR